jgi:putative ABC transport system substrate-binding protein
VKRRDFLVACAAAAVPVAHAQPRGERQARVAFVTRGALGLNVGAFREGLQSAGWTQGRNLVLDVHTAPLEQAGYQTLADTLVREKCDIVVGSGPATRPLYSALGGRLPMAYAFSGDPVEAKIANSLASPGVRASGVSMLALELVGKRMELLKEVAPSLRRVAVLANPNHPGERAEFRESSRAAARLGVELAYFDIRTQEDVMRAFEAVRSQRAGALDVFPDGLAMNQAGRVAEFSRELRIPAISGWNVFAKAGNVFSYGPNLSQAFRQVATFVDRMLRGAAPEVLPVEFPTRVEFIVNLKAARAIGLAVPQSVLLRADGVIE